jgi:chromosome segregation ATPase
MAELASIRADLGDIAPGEVGALAGERASLASEVEGSRGEIERIHGDLQRLQAELETRVAEHARREQEAGAQQQGWEADVHAARSEADRLEALVRDRDAELAAALEAQERIATERESARVEARRLRMALDQYEREQCDRGELDLVEIDRLQAEIDHLRAELEQLRAEPVRNGVPASSPDRDEELRTALAQVESLQRELAESHRLQSQMSAMLGGIGIRFREI